MNHSAEVLFFGCYHVSGHFLYCKSNPNMKLGDTPWGSCLDGGLLTDNYYGADTTPTGEYSTAKKDGWTAISFWDRSGPDKRPGCNSTFLIRADLTPEELLRMAVQQWPEVFRRLTFALKPRNNKP